jgi:hypothetical protein
MTAVTNEALWLGVLTRMWTGYANLTTNYLTSNV